MTSQTFDHPTSEELTELRDRTWSLIYPETWRSGSTLVHKRGPFKILYDRQTNEVELWRMNAYNVYTSKLRFRRPPYTGDWEKNCSYCITVVECLPILRELMVLDDLADI